MLNSNERAYKEASDSKELTTMIAVFVVGGAGAVFPLVQPLFVGGVMDHYGLNVAQAGLLASTEMAGAGVGIIFVSLVVPYTNWHKLLLAFATVAMISNGLSYLVSELELFLAARLAAGMGQGSLMGLATAAMSQTKTPDKNYAIFLVLLFSFGTFLVYGISTLSTEFGIKAGYLIFIVLPAIAAALVVRFPARSSVTTANTGTTSSTGRTNNRLVPIIFGLVGILVFFIGLASVWPFMERIGIELNMSSGEAGKILAFATLFGIAGGIFATLLGTKIGRFFPVTFGITGIVACIGVLYFFPSQEVFRISSKIFMFCWIFVVPYLMGVIAFLDPSGRAAVLNVGMQYLGFTIGPSFVGFLFSGEGFIKGLIVGLMCCSFGLLVFLPLSLIPNTQTHKGTSIN